MISLAGLCRAWGWIGRHRVFCGAKNLIKHITRWEAANTITPQDHCYEKAPMCSRDSRVALEADG